MIREGQLETAQAEIAKMQQDGIQIESWINVLLLHSVVNHGDFDAVLRLIYQFEDGRVEVPNQTWLHVLDKASHGLNFEITSWVWQRMVEPMHIEPSVAICHDALRIAARYGKAWLAESVHQLMESRQDEVSEVDKEHLDMAYIRSGDTNIRRKYRRGNLWPLFRKDKGLAAARFNPRIAIENLP